MSTQQQTQPQDSSLLDDLLAETNLQGDAEAFAVAKKGVEAFVAEMLKTPQVKADKAAVDAMIAEIDARLSAQINVVLHHPAVQKLESAWRGLKYVVDQVNFRENVRISLLNCSKDDLLNDFEDSPELVKSGLYRTVYSAEYGTFGGQPYGAICAQYDFGPGPQDIALLQSCASVAAMSHAPFIANADVSMFGVKTYDELGKLKDLESLLEGPQYARWNSFRDSEDARYVGLAMPRFLLRLPYGESTIPVKSFNFNESNIGEHDSYLWGHASQALVTRIADSFAKYRWSPNIIGPQAGGAVENLPLHQYKAMGEIQTKLPVEVQLTERREFELAEAGFIGLTMRKDTDNAAFFSANSVQRPRTFAATAEGKATETNYRLGTQLPYMFIITRLAHYLKVLQREQIGTWKERAELETELNKWIGQYVSDMEAPSAGVRALRPLRQASISVSEIEGQPGVYRCDLKVRPHMKYMGASFTLSLVGKLDKQ